MAQEYIAICESKNEIGFIALNKSVFQTIVNNVINEEKNVEFAESNSPFSKVPLSCKLVDEQLVITVSVKVRFNDNINEVSEKIQKKIYENIKHMTGYSPDFIDVKISGFLFDK